MRDRAPSRRRASLRRGRAARRNARRPCRRRRARASGGSSPSTSSTARPSRAQSFGDADRRRTLRLAERTHDVVESARQRREQAVVGEQLGDHDVAEAEADRRDRRPAERFEQPVVATAAAHRAQLALGVVGLEDDAGVVGETAHHRSVEVHVLRDPVGVEQLEETAQLGDRGASPAAPRPPRRRGCVCRAAPPRRAPRRARAARRRRDRRAARPPHRRRSCRACR